MNNDIEITQKERTQTELKAKPKAKEPPLYQVVMINDDYTTMDFVVEVLRKVFNMDPIKANNIMLEIHHCGQSICGVYPREVAEMKVSEVLTMAQQHSHPLRCFFEPTI